MRDWADSCANIRACRYRLLPESSSGCSRCTSGIGNARWPKGIHDVPDGESILRTNLCARQPGRVTMGCPRWRSHGSSGNSERPSALSALPRIRAEGGAQRVRSAGLEGIKRMGEEKKRKRKKKKKK